MPTKKPANKKAAKPRRRRPPAKPDIPPEPWEQQPGESAPAFQAFATYRDLGAGERSVRRVARIVNKAGSLIGGWSTTHRWVERSKAWDMHLDRTRQAELEQRQIETAERHALTLGAHLQGTAIIQQKFLEKCATRDGQEWLEKLPLAEHAELAIAASRVAPRLVPMERLSLGLSTTNVAGHKGGPIETDDPDARHASKTEAELRAMLLGADAGAAVEREKAAEKDSPG